jgi:nitroreductase
VPDFFDVVHHQRACREFKPDPVPDELVERVLEAATFAPSAENRQPWVFVVVREASQRAAIGELNRRAWQSGGRRYSEGRLTPAMLAEVDRGALGGVASAPVLVVVCGDTELGNAAVIESSVYPAVQNLLLAAAATGLGSALTTLPLLFASELTQLLDLPGHVRPLAVVPLGWPVAPMGPPRREPVAGKTHRDRYGSEW